MQAFIEEADEKLESRSDAAIKDPLLLASVQVINHFKISMYGTAAAFANVLNMLKHAVVFHKAEIKAKQVDDRFTSK